MKEVTAQTLVDACSTLNDPAATPVVVRVNGGVAVAVTSVVVNGDGAIELAATADHA